jgi:hypothetical protein
MQKMTHHAILATPWDATAQPDLPTEVELGDSREQPFVQILRFILANFSESRRRVLLLHWRSTKTSGATSSHLHSALEQIHRSPTCIVFICHLPTCPGNCSSFRGGLFTCVSSRAQAQGKSPLSASPAKSASLTIPYGKKGSRASDTKQPGLEHALKVARWVVQEDFAAL